MRECDTGGGEGVKIPKLLPTSKSPPFAVSDRLPDITHIVFVVHGVGQVIDDTTIIRNTNIMRDNVQSLLSKHCPHFQRDTGQRVEFFPVEWRSSLRISVAICPLNENI